MLYKQKVYKLIMIQKSYNGLNVIFKIKNTFTHRSIARKVTTPKNYFCIYKSDLVVPCNKKSVISVVIWNTARLHYKSLCHQHKREAHCVGV